MKFEITVSKKGNMDDIPKSCHMCIFNDVCDLTVADITKRGGLYFRAWAMRGKPKNCPLKVVEEDSNNNN